MYCIHLRKRKNKPFCKLLNKEITFAECSANNSANNCKEYKTKKIKNSFHKKCTIVEKKFGLKWKNAQETGRIVQKMHKLKKQTAKHRKTDRNRFSIIVDDLSICCFPGCGCNIGIVKHEVFYGSCRHTSIKWGLVIPLCEFHHTIDITSIHKDRHFDLKMKFLAQKIFVEKYSLELFIKEFGMDYIEKYKKRY